MRGGDQPVLGRPEREQFAATESGDFAHTTATPKPTAAAMPRRWSSTRAATGVAQSLLMAARRAAAREIARGAAFCLVPVFFGSGALIYFSLPFEPRPTPIFAAVLACLAGLWLARRRHILGLAFVMPLLLLLGMAAGKVETWSAGTRVLGSDVTTLLTGRIVEIEARAGGRIRFTIDVETTARPHLSFAPQRVRATSRGNPEGLEVGDRLTGLVRLMAPSGPVRPQGYDFAFQSYFDGIGAVGFFPRDPRRATTHGAAPGLYLRFAAWMEQLREDLGRHIALQIGGEEGEIAAALIAGVRGGIADDVQEDLRRSGLAHILSISGLHMALVAVTVMQAIRFGFALFPAFAARIAVKKWAAAAALVVSAFYLFLSGNDVAAQRSFIMLAIMLLALVFDRSALSMRNLALSALIVLVLAPHEIVGPSFQMSFAATAALVAAYRAWSERRARAPSRPPAERGRIGRLAAAGMFYVGGLAFTSIVAGSATAIFAIWHFQRAAPLGLVGNLAAMPVISLSVMPWAVLAVALLPFGLDGLPLYVMGKGLTAVIAIAHWVSVHSPLDATGMIPLYAVVLCAAGIVILTMTTTRLYLLALPLVVGGIGLACTRHLPAVLVSEDARLVAIENEDGKLAVNRARPPSFEMQDWMRAMAAADYARPQQTATLAEAAQHLAEGAQAFQCAAGVCIARAGPDGAAILAYATTGRAAETACDLATLVVVADPSARDACRHEGPTVITGWHLARRGSAMVDFTVVNGKPEAHITYALGEPWRPWHTQRAWSRAARGLPPYRPPAKKAKPRERASASPGEAGQ